METYECNVVFLNEKYGEFQYTIEGIGELPEPIKRIDNKECYVEDSYDFILDIELQNKYLQNTLLLLKTEKMPKTVRKQTRNSLFVDIIDNKNKFLVECNRPVNFSMPNIISYAGDLIAQPVQPNQTLSSIELAINDKKEKPKKEKEGFDVDINLNANGDKEGNSRENSIKIRDLNKSESHFSQMGQVLNNSVEVLKLPIKFMAKRYEIYECDIVIKSLENPNDVRLIKLSVNVKPKNIYGKIEFNCPVLCEIIQKIPIYNDSEFEWNVKYELSDNCNLFVNI